MCNDVLRFCRYCPVCSFSCFFFSLSMGCVGPFEKVVGEKTGLLVRFGPETPDFTQHNRDFPFAPVCTGISLLAVLGVLEGLFPITGLAHFPSLRPPLAPDRALSTSFEKTCKSRLRGCFLQDWPCAGNFSGGRYPRVSYRDAACTGTGLVHTFANKRPPSCLRGSLT